jgi:hypothetical protein
MTLIWEEALQKLIFDYAKKNSKKKGEYSQVISLLNSITYEARDRFLKKYIGRCKVTHALAFFQWRCRTALE